MELTVDQHVPADTSTVLSVLTDEDFISFAGRGTQVATVDATVTTTPEGDVVSAVRRSVPSAMIPPQARPFVGDSIEIRHVEAWSRPREGENGPRYGTFAAEVAGAPVQVTGTVRLVPAGSGTTLSYVLDVRASIPLVGGMVEQATGNVVRTALDQLGEAVRDWLDGER